MNKESIILQNLIFPDGDQFNNCSALFFRGIDNSYNRTSRELVIPANGKADFNTYFNSLPVKKWREYTVAEKLSLNVTLQGSGVLELLAYNLSEPVIKEKEKRDPTPLDSKVNAVVLERHAFDFAQATTKTIELPQSSSVILSFSIIAHSDVICSGGSYSANIPEDLLQDVRIALCTTTFKKEEYIIANLQQIRDQLFEKNNPLKENLEVFVVDNGRTLMVNQVVSKNIHLFANPNVGGSGGFARGMIEVLQSKQEFTHVLIMDDDVVILPESLMRTYALLRLINPKYQDAFIAGAMLQAERPFIQHEDIGFIFKQGFFASMKGEMNVSRLSSVVQNAQIWKQPKHAYAAWWYCCVPIRFVREDNLPLPVFVRGDDVEFSLRNNVKIIDMPAICVWHVGFTQKFSRSMERYQVIRNSLILQAALGDIYDVSFYSQLKSLLLRSVLRYDYGGAELILDALEDFLKGPDFIMSLNGEQTVQEKSSLNEKLLDIDVFEEVQDRSLVTTNKIYTDSHRSLLKILVYRLSLNGHIFVPDALLSKEVPMVPCDWEGTPGKHHLKKKVLAVNPRLGLGNYRFIDRDRAREIYRKYSKLNKMYKLCHQDVEADYFAKAVKMRSLDFWAKYLGLNE